MRISDWSSDVCSSDLFPHGCGDHNFLYLKKLFRGEAAGTLFHEDETRLTRAGWLRRNASGLPEVTEAVAAYFMAARRPVKRSEARRVGKEGVSPCRYRGSPTN